jgi:hypothetical protein
VLIFIIIVAIGLLLAWEGASRQQRGIHRKQ